jgi:predicted RNA-binding Zn-ribbon protein involved in translation (DUF1610 family)
MPIIALILSIIILSLYIGAVIWIYKDSRKRQDELALVWCILALLSFPIVLIIYIIVTRSNNENYTCSSCGFKLKANWRFCPNCNQELKIDVKEEKYEDMNKVINIKKPIGILPIAIFVAGIVLFVTFLTFSLMDINNSFTKVNVPGTTTINLKDKGEYTIFYEYKNDEEESKNYSEVKDMDISITNINTKKTVSISNSGTSSHYSFSGAEGRDIFKFNVEEPGNYEIGANSKATNASKITISITQNFIGKILVTVFGSLIIMFGAILSGVFIIIRRIK